MMRAGGKTVLARVGGTRPGSGVRRGLCGVALVLATSAAPAAGAGGAAGQASGPASAQTVATATAQSANGRTIYLEGRLADGSPLRGERAGGLGLSGAAAACVNCHRRSGLGGAEGRNYVAPIDAGSLFAARAPGTGASATGAGRPAYDQATLARAIRDGVDAGGRRLDYLMPRYAIDDAGIAALVTYLRASAAEPVPGVEDGVLQLATVIAPGVGAGRVQAMRDALTACVTEHNAGPPPVRGRRKLGADMQLGAPLPWRLHVWELSGEPSGWAAQLAEHGRTQPVFALLGGLGRGDWAPVHDYCEANALPCVFPHVEAPVAAAEADFFTLYLSRGVLLEAALIANHLGASAKTQVVQVWRDGDAAAAAGAEALRRVLADRGIATQARVLGVAEAIDGSRLAAGENTLRVLWLRSDDLKALAGLAPGASPIYLSATLAGPEGATLPPAWKARALLASPYELPERRQARETEFKTWLAARGLRLTDPAVQADAFVACAAFGAGMNELAGHLRRDYLVERLEVITGRSRTIGLYPQLTLGIGQRFASKSGYLLRFAGADGGARLEAVGERTAP